MSNPEQRTEPRKNNHLLKKAFNFAVKAGIGAAVCATLKTGAVFGATLAGAPVVTTLLISSVSVGIGSTILHDYFKRRGQRKQGAPLTPYFSKAHGKEFMSKENAKVFGISTLAALVGSALYLGFHDGIIQNGWNHLTGHHTPVTVTPAQPPVVVVTPPVPHTPLVPPMHHVVTTPSVTTPAPQVHHTVPPVVTAPVPQVHHAVTPAVTPAPVHCDTPVQQFENLIKGHHVSDGVRGALHRATVSTNAHVHAQGVKDLGYYAQNGLGGVPKNDNVALQLFNQAAHEGNKQAMRGMLYLQHYGFDGITTNKTASLAAMKTIHHDALATKFVKVWGAGHASVAPAKFNADTIVKGVKFACH